MGCGRGGGAPCLSRRGSLIADMEAVRYPIGGGYAGSIVWVRC